LVDDLHMSASADLGAFLVVATIVVITPGVDMAVVTRNAILDGRRAAVLTALGINLGVLFWVTAAALGLAAVVAASAPAFAAIKLIAVFFTGLLPQFVGSHGSAADLLLLGLLFNALGVAWLTSYALLAARGRNVLSRPAVKPTLDRATGIVLIGLGARLALERRP
jgi:threonine/homoserine/homoserine lactone efflux protein